MQPPITRHNGPYLSCYAGFPVYNIQATLDVLTAEGLSAAVFEEVDAIEAPGKRASSATTTSYRLKECVILQGR